MICKICDGALQLFASIDGWEIRRCGQCGFGQVDATPDQLATYYDGAYFAGDRTNFRQGKDKAISPAKAYWLDRAFAGLGAAPCCLEIGPGHGNVVPKYLVASWPGSHYQAVEISTYAAETLSAKGHPVHVGRVVDPAFTEAHAQAFDIVLGAEVIEHDSEPRQFAQACHDVLKPGGVCVFTTGNLDSLMARMQGKSWYYLTPPAHVSFFTPTSARKLFLDAGFTDVDIWRVGFSHIARALKFSVPWLLPVVDRLGLPTGMTITARRRG